jgi:dephospho-CoA kinase
MTDRIGNVRPEASRTIRIGLTGPIGCGKSTVAGWLREAGATVVDADQLARDVVEPGEPALAAVVAAFGQKVLRPSGELDRAALGDLVFREPAELARLEAIVHPAVRPRVLAAIEASEQAGAPAVVIEAIKLVEGRLAQLCDEVWLVTCTPVVQSRRLAARGLDFEAASLRIRAQSGLVRRASRSATRVLDTSGEPGTTRDAVIVAYRDSISPDR